MGLRSAEKSFTYDLKYEKIFEETKNAQLLPFPGLQEEPT
jgi:hypothetical protein